jgi:hypothetical protein
MLAIVLFSGTRAEAQAERSIALSQDLDQWTTDRIEASINSDGVLRVGE